MATGFRIRQVATAALVANALRPPSNYWLGVPSMFAGWLAGELTPHLLTATAADSARELSREHKDRVGLVLAAASAAGMGVMLRQSMQARGIAEDALRDGIGSGYDSGLPVGPELATPWYQLACPFVIRDGSVEKTSGIRYGPEGKLNTLDLYRRRGPSTGNAPVILHLHGGMWMSGDRRFEGLPLMHRMARRGWLGVNIDYRLSPRDPFPAQIIDVKRAIAWIREHAAEYGANPSFIAVAGGSAGGHLAALAGLTANDPAFQPGFEDADTSIQAVVGNYGIYDFAAQSGSDHAVKRRDRFLARFVLKKDPVQQAAAFEQASPLAHVNPDAPPFFVVHGRADTGVEVEESRYFVERLRAVSRAAVAYAELPGAQHAFDVFPSIRSAAVLRAADRFLRWSHAAALG